jgi:hypothetical protein
MKAPIRLPDHGRDLLVVNAVDETTILGQHRD